MRNINVRNIFIERVKDLLVEKNMTVSKFSKEIGIPRSTITNWLLNTRTIQIDSLVVIANYFNVSTDYLLGREN